MRIAVVPVYWLVLLSLWLPLTAMGDFVDCRSNFYGRVPPDYIEPKLINHSQPLCFDGFAVMYSGITRTPLWSATHLDRQRLQQAAQLPRNDSFHEESRLPPSMRARLQDYAGSGYDRGHLSPNGDMANISQQYDSFSLANIAPQSPRNNRYVWRRIESSTRYLTKQYGEIYVVTGVAFVGNQLTQLNGRVLVPSHFFKAVYIPVINQAGVYYTPNDESDRIEVISIDELALRSGIDVMPAIDARTKANAFALPMSFADEVNSEDSYDGEAQPWWWLLLLEVAWWLLAQMQH